MVRRFVFLFVLFLAACTKYSGYGETVTVQEGGSAWDVRLVKAFHNESAVLVMLEYKNRTGESFTIKPDNIVLTDDAGNRWIADGRYPLIPLLLPGQSNTIKAAFSDVAVSERPLYLEPLAGLVHAKVKYLLKAKGGKPLPGNHESDAWDQAQ